MTSLLVRLFIKDHKNTADTKVRASYGTLAGAVGIVTNLLISAVKLFVGYIAGSVSVIADAANNLSDAGSSLITLVGFALSGRPADKKHPYGHARYEYLTGLFTSLIVTLLGVFFMIDSVKRIFSGSRAEFETAMIAVLLVSALVKLWQFFFYRSLAKKINSDSLRASSADSINDFIMTLIVVAGAVVSKYVSLPIDGYLGALIAIFIFIAGVRLSLDALSPIIGSAPSKETTEAIESLILSEEFILGIHDMMIHSYGANRIFCSLHAEVSAELDIVECHDMIDNIEERVQRELGITVVIHADPVAVGDPKTAEMRAHLEAILSALPVRCSFHDFRVVLGPTHDNVIFDISLPFDKRVSEADTVEEIKREFLKKYPTSVLKIKVDRDIVPS